MSNNNNIGAIVRLLCLVLAFVSGATYAGQKVYVPSAGVYVDMDTGEAYPRVAPNVAIDPNTGRAFVPATERQRQAAQPEYGAGCELYKPAGADKYAMRCPR